MTKILFITLVLLAFHAIPSVSQRQFTVYFQSWSEKWAAQGSELTLANIPPYVTTIILTFLKPDNAYKAGSLNLLDAGLQFSSDGAVVKDAIELAKANGAQVLVGVGGSSYPNWGSLDPDGLAALVADFGLDGIDINYQPAQPGCSLTDGAMTCTVDSEFQNIVSKIKKALPSSAIISLAGTNTGAYGEGDFETAQPQGTYTGMSIPLLKSEAGKSLNQINILSFDAGPTYDPKQAFQAYRSLFTGKITLGVSVPPESWGGHVISISELDGLCDFVNEKGKKGDGIMLFSLNKVLETEATAKNPDATMIAEEVCTKLGLSGCEHAQNSTGSELTEEESQLGEEEEFIIEEDTPSGETEESDNIVKRQFTAYFQTWSEKWASEASELAIANYPPYVTTIILSFFRPDNTYEAGSLKFPPSGLEFNSDGEVVKEAIELAQSKGAKVLASVGGATYQNWADLNTAGIAAFVFDFSLDGIDISYQADNAECSSKNGKFICDTDQELHDIVNKITEALPSSKFISVAGSSTGAYGEGKFTNAEPITSNNGVFVNLLKSDVEKTIDQINILTYDTDPKFDPKQAFDAYRSLFKGMLTIGITVPTETGVFGIDDVDELCDYVNKNGEKGDGMMLWSLNFATEGDVSLQKPDATMISQEICKKFELPDCQLDLYAPTTLESSPETTDDIPGDEIRDTPPFDSNYTRQFAVYFQSWSERPATTGEDLSLANLPTYITTIIITYFQPDNSYDAGSFSLYKTGLGFRANGSVVKEAIGIAKSKGARILLTIGGKNYQSWDMLNANGIAAFVSDFGIDGVDIYYDLSNAGCTTTVKGNLTCTIEEKLKSHFENIVKVLPPSVLVSIAAPSNGAYGIGEYIEAKPSGDSIGAVVKLLNSTVGERIGQINIMAFDAGPNYDPKQAFQAYRNIFNGTLTLGVEVPPEGWGGHVISINELIWLSDFVNKNGGEGDGMMLWTLHKRPEDAISDENPDARMMSATICERLQLGDCAVGLDIPTTLEVLQSQFDQYEDSSFYRQTHLFLYVIYIGLVFYSF